MFVRLRVVLIGFAFRFVAPKDRLGKIALCILHAFLTANLIFTNPTQTKPVCRTSFCAKNRKQELKIAYGRERNAQGNLLGVRSRMQSPLQNPTPTGQFTAENAGQRNAHQEDDTKLANLITTHQNSKFFFSSASSILLTYHHRQTETHKEESQNLHSR